MDKISPIVLTSKRAKEHLQDITAQHADILRGMEEQSLKVMAYKADKQAKKQQLLENNQKIQTDNEKMRIDAETKQLEAQNKAKELSIKEKALAI